MALHAVECANTLRPGVPIYFASDSKVAVDTIRHLSQSDPKRSVVIFSDDDETNSKEALHLDKVTYFTTQPSDYYPTFVDFLIMSNGRCLSYGQGGFGLFASLLSYDATCTVKHSNKKRLLNCTTNDNGDDID
jgi:hypothetical protein